MSITLKLTEPNGNPLWVAADLIAVMYRLKGVPDAEGNSTSYTVVLVGGMKVHVSETPEQIIDLMPARLSL